MTSHAAPRVPAGIEPPGKAFWHKITRTYELDPAELLLLTRCCKIIDVLAEIDRRLAADGLTVTGSMGQPRAHPLLAAKSEQERVLDRLCISLALPLADEQAGTRRTPAALAKAKRDWQARKAARGYGAAPGQ